MRPLWDNVTLKAGVLGLSLLPISHGSLGCGALGEQDRGTATLTTKPVEEVFNASHFQIRCGCSDAMTAQSRVQGGGRHQDKQGNQKASQEPVMAKPTHFSLG